MVNNKYFQEKMIMVKKYFLGHDRMIKLIELYRGLYRYPRKMIGRKVDLHTIKKNIDVLVIAAHPDDDIIGLGTTLFRHRLKEENVVVAFVTNGSCWKEESWRIKQSEAKRRAEIRYNEAANALDLIGIPKENVVCLGFPDGGTHRYLMYLGEDIKHLLQSLNPKRIYAHCIEGGHSDHDMTSYVVKKICNKLGYLNVFEWTEYHPQQPLGTKQVKFLPFLEDVSEKNNIIISKEERTLKKKMLSIHKSQDVEKYFGHGEAIRKAEFSRIEMELNNFCQLPKRRLIPVVKSFNKSINDIVLIQGNKGCEDSDAQSKFNRASL